MTRTDPYPTRLRERMAPFERQDPVVHTSGRAREEGPLTREQVDAFERDGLLALEGFLPAEEMQGFLDDLAGFERDEAFKAEDRVIAEPHSNEIRSIFAIHGISERFDRLTREPKLLDIAHQLVGSDVYIHQSRINDKPGFKGKGFNWHSDFETWHSEDGMPRMRCVSFSIALTENLECNGPLMLIPGSHRYFIPTVGETPEQNWKESLKVQTVGVPDVHDLQAMADKGGLVAPKGPPGSLTIFECNTLHASTENLSPYPRSNLFFVYNSVENTLQEPFCGLQPRPEFIATREDFSALRPVEYSAA